MKNVKNQTKQYPKEYIFSNPNLKFNQIISKDNYSGGFKYIFEIFNSFQNKEVYLVSSNKRDYVLDIISINKNRLENSLKGHNNFINLVKYFKKDNNNKEYLISSDKDNIIIIWDINKKYSIFYKISECRSSQGFISGAIIYFNNKDIYGKIDDYIIISFDFNYYTNIFSLEKQNKIGIIKQTNEHNTYYILLWFNKKENNNFIIELSDKKIFIYDINKNSLFHEFNISYNNCKLNSGFIYNKNNNDYLIASSDIGILIEINLETKEIYHISQYIFTKKQIGYTNSSKKKIYLSHILQWSNKYMIAFEYFNKGFIIMDIETFKLISYIKGKHTGGIIYAKKFFHPFYGESLLTSGQDNNIILWSKLKA